MEQIRRQVQLGNLQLAKLNHKQQPVPMQINQLQQKQYRINKNTLILQKLKSLQQEQRLAWVTHKKEQANQQYNNKKYEDAIQIYLEALLGLQIQGRDQQKVKTMNVDYKYPLLLNIVTCLYQKKQYSKAVELCDRIICQKHGANNLKAYYKKTNCLICLGQFKQAKQNIQKMNHIIQQHTDVFDNRKEIITKNDLASLSSQIKQKQSDQKEIYRKIFIQNEVQSQPLINKRQNNSKQQQKIQYCQPQKQLDCCSKTYNTILSFFKRLVASSKQRIS